MCYKGIGLDCIGEARPLAEALSVAQPHIKIRKFIACV